MADKTKATKELAQAFSDLVADDLDDVLHEKLKIELDARFEQVNSKIDDQNKLLTMVMEGFNEDRKDISQTRVAQEGIRQAVIELLEASSRQTKTIVGKMTFEVQKQIDTIPDKAAEGIEKIAKSKSLPPVQSKEKKRSWNPLKRFKKIWQSKLSR